MARLLCHGIYQKAEIFKVVPTRENVQDEFLLYLKKCRFCSNPVLEIIRIDTLGKILDPVRIKTSKIQNMLDSAIVLWKPDTMHFYNVHSGKYALYYNEFGVKKRCYQNFSSLQIGKVETDPIKDLKIYKNYAPTIKQAG